MEIGVVVLLLFLLHAYVWIRRRKKLDGRNSNPANLATHDQLDMLPDREATYEYRDGSSLPLNMFKYKLLSNVKSGSWRMEIPKAGSPRLYADEVMQGLLGIEDRIAPEECYEYWVSNVDSEYLSVVLKAVDTIAEGNLAEVNYLWHHPVLGVRNIRCGGMGDNDGSGALALYGFHQDLTGIEVVLKEDDVQYMIKAFNDFLTANIYIDLNTKRYSILNHPDYMDESEDFRGTITHLREMLIDTYVDKEFTDELIIFLNEEDMEERIANQKNISLEYMDNVTREWQRARLLPLRYDSDGRLKSVMIVVISIDTEIKSRMKQEQQLKMIRSAYKNMFSMTQYFFGIVNIESRLLKRLDTDSDHMEFSPETPYSYDYVIEYAAANSIDPEESERYLQLASIEKVVEELLHSSKYVFHINRKKKDGRTGLFAYEFCYFDEEHENLVCMIEDVTEKEEVDLITGAVNLDGFVRRASEILENSDDRYAMLHFDINGFKAINSQFGYERGNQILKKICDSIVESDLHPCVISRSGGDHFDCMVLMENLNYVELTQLCRQGVTIGNKTISLRLNCGIYEIEDRNMSIRGMCDRARLAKTALKDEASIYPYHVFTEKMNEKYLKQKEIINTLDDAVRKGEFYNYYQPIYDAKTGELSSAEALVRWIKEDGEVISPDAFIPTLEENGQISIVDYNAGLKIESLQRSRIAAGKKVIPISLNLSRKDFFSDEFLASMLGFVNDTSIPTACVRFEITESAYYDIPDKALKVLRRLREYGAKLLIDDFGKGYSSLSMLTEHTFDIVKLDMYFIRQIGGNARAEAVIAAAINLAHKIDAQIIAEGVETDVQYEFLRDAGCDFIQGYYFSKPLPAGDFEALLDAD